MPCNGSKKNLSSAWRTPHLTSPQPLQLCSFLQLWLPPSLSPPPPPGVLVGILHAGSSQSDNVAFKSSSLLGSGGEMWRQLVCLNPNFCFLLVLKHCVCISCGWRRAGVMFLYGDIKLFSCCFCCPLTVASASLLPLFLSLSGVFKLYFHIGCRLI